MTTYAIPTTAAVPHEPRNWLGSRVHDTAVLVRRNIIHITREPLQLSDVTVQPVLFTLLFIYVFGSGVPIRGGSYKDFAIGGLILLNLTTSSMGTAVGLVTDLTTGTIDRFRTLPMWRSAILVGRSVADVLTSAMCIGIVALTGLAIGWRPHASALSVIAGFAMPLYFSYALSWACACLGIVSKGPESAQGMGFLAIFPLAFVSNALVPTSGMPGWLQAIANWNPVSSVAAAIRHLWGNPNPSATASAWPMQHPVAAALLWSTAILVVFAPLAAHLYRQRTTG
jgi:ABC-2 type transport system permease protein